LGLILINIYIYNRPFTVESVSPKIKMSKYF
jgi:hypothetical protein